MQQLTSFRRLTLWSTGVLLAPMLVWTGVSTATAATTSGLAVTWGGNGYGQLGSGDNEDRLTPGDVVGGHEFVDLHGGREHVIALTSAGTVFVWGSNEDGQLGTGDSANHNSPVQVPGLSGVVAVETGHNYSVALKSNGTVWAWGLNANGQLGDGTTTERHSPVQVAGLTDAVAIAAGRDMTYAIRSNGQLVAWGRNAEGQLGNGTTTASRSPVRVGTLADVVGVAGGRDHALALTSNGTVWAWGWNAYGMVGDGTTTNRTSPVAITSGVAEVAAGAHHSYARTTEGGVLAWGRNYRYELGDGTRTTRLRPTTVPGIGDATSLGSGRDFGIVTRADGRVQTWGHNAYGQLGEGTTATRTTAVFVPGITNAIKAGGGGAAYAVILISGSTPPVNQPPTARIGADCTGLACSFDGSGSGDPDGTVAGYAWDFGDGRTSANATPAHTYSDPGTYTVRLTVTDDEGATDATTLTVTVKATASSDVTFVAASISDTNSVTPSIGVPAGIQAGDRLVLFMTTNRGATATTPSGWSLEASASDSTDLRSWVFTRVATADLAGSTVHVSLDAISKTSLTLLAYSGAGAPEVQGATETGPATTTHDAPAVNVAADGSVVARYWADKTSTAHAWNLPALLTERAASTGSGGGLITAIAGDSPADSGRAPAITATSDVSSAKEIAWSVALPPA